MNTVFPDMSKVDPLDLAWLAGLLEGEGCFTLVKSQYARIQLGMTDEDIVDRAALLFQAGAREVMVPTNPKHNIQYRVTLNGGMAIAWMKILFPYMGIRRKEEISFCIKHHLGDLNIGLKAKNNGRICRELALIHDNWRDFSAACVERGIRRNSSSHYWNKIKPNETK